MAGVIDGIDYAGDHYYVHGWACQESQRPSIDVISTQGLPQAKAEHLLPLVLPTSATNPQWIMNAMMPMGVSIGSPSRCPTSFSRTFQGKKLWAHGIA